MFFGEGERRSKLSKAFPGSLCRLCVMKLFEAFVEHLTSHSNNKNSFNRLPEKVFYFLFPKRHRNMFFESLIAKCDIAGSYFKLLSVQYCTLVARLSPLFSLCHDEMQKKCLNCYLSVYLLPLTILCNNNGIASGQNFTGGF